MITEGGNVFKNPDGALGTQRVNQADVPATISFVEKVLGVKFPKDRWLGSTGRKPTSGDLDLAVDTGEINKDQLADRLVKWAQTQGQNPADWVVKRGEVHFKTPIAGDPKKGYVQTDFMFMPDLEWGTFYYSGAEGSAYKGMNRNVLMSSIAKSLGLKVGANGMISRTTNEVVPGGKDPDRVAKVLLGPNASKENLKNVESIYAAMAKDPNKDAKLADFKEYLTREGLPQPDAAIKESEVSFMARLRDRIVNQGMQVIVEGVRIEHPEDLLFSAKPSAGIQRAIDGLEATIKNPQDTTVKWDGKPAIIFGRKPTGEFVLTDKGGFLKADGSGLATSPEMMADILSNRKGGGREELAQLYTKLFPLLRRAVPQNFRGYIQGDLLYSSKPAVKNNEWVFEPNTVLYRVPVNSELGKKINDSQVAVVIHTALSGPGADPVPIRAADLANSPGLLVLDPSLTEIRKLKINDRAMQDLKALQSKYGAEMDRLFDPNELRNRKISNLPELIKMYINSRVRSGSYDNLVTGFGEWVQQREPTKAPRIFEWANENKRAIAAVFQAFLDISAIKNDLVRQLDSQAHDVQASINDEPGHEGYVGQGLKFVDRMRFSQANFARNNPNLP